MNFQDFEPPVRIFPESVAPTIVKAIECLDCGCIVYSRCKTDKRTCLCGNIIVEGGIQPSRISFETGKRNRELTIVVNKDLNDFYYDWNLGIDRYGMLFPQDNKKHVSSWKYVVQVIVPSSKLVLYSRLELLKENEECQKSESPSTQAQAGPSL